MVPPASCVPVARQASLWTYNVLHRRLAFCVSSRVGHLPGSEAEGGRIDIFSSVIMACIRTRCRSEREGKNSGWREVKVCFKGPCIHELYIDKCIKDRNGTNPRLSAVLYW
jgi:hypothetical protein